MTVPRAQCSICSGLRDSERGFQKRGREQDDTFLPAAAERLEVARDFTPGGGNRLSQLRRCPQCGTYYLYETDYEFLMSGSEDEQKLDRLTDAQATTYLKGPGPRA